MSGRIGRLLPNALLSVAVTALLFGGLEGLCRVLEARRPPARVAEYIWDWEKMWEDDFYTVGTDGFGWPPWEEFNADGLRDRAHSPEKPEGTWRLVCLGDSVTMGDGVRPKDAFPQLLQTLLDAEGLRVEVFNVALWGWSTRQEVIAYRRLARRYKPDQVLLGVCLNDIPELQNNLSRPPHWVAVLHERSALVRRIINAENREIASVEELFTKKNSNKVKEGFARFFSELRTLKREVEADGATLSVLIVPFRFQLTPKAPPPSVQETILGFCRAESITCIDLLPKIREVGESAFVDYDHLSPLGSRVVVEDIKGLLPRRVSDQDMLLAYLGRNQRGATAVSWLKAPSSSPKEGVAEGLLPALRAEDPSVRGAATWALARLGPEASPVREPLAVVLRKDVVPFVRAGAAGALGSMASPSSAPVLFEALGDTDEAVRWSAARALGRLRLTADFLPQLIEALKSADPYVRGFAAWSLGEMGTMAAGATGALVEALRAEEASGRGTAIPALGKIGPAARQAVPALVQALKSPYGPRRWSAARTLGRIGPGAEAALPALILALEDPNDHVRLHAARALGRIGRSAAAPALEKALKDPNEGVRAESRAALDRIRTRS